MLKGIFITYKQCTMYSCSNPAAWPNSYMKLQHFMSNILLKIGDFLYFTPILTCFGLFSPLLGYIPYLWPITFVLCILAVTHMHRLLIFHVSGKLHFNPSIIHMGPLTPKGWISTTCHKISHNINIYRWNDVNRCIFTKEIFHSEIQHIPAA